LTPSLVPIKPFPVPPPNPPAVEIDEFVPDKGQLCDTFDSYSNNLYVYPLSLKYEHQKSFPKARNIACCVEIRDLDEDRTVPLKVGNLHTSDCSINWSCIDYFFFKLHIKENVDTKVTFQILIAMRYDRNEEVIAMRKL